VATTIAFSESEPAYDQITILQLNDGLIHMSQLDTKADITTFICSSFVQASKMKARRKIDRI
jgi:hypothetical protein